MDTILIIGAGVFGLSTALAASSTSQVTLIDDGDASAASRGLGRIYRSQYPRKEYEELALDAKNAWEAGPFHDNFHHAIKNIEYPDGTRDKDPDAAWIDASVVMRNALQEAKQRGVTVVSGTVTKLIWGEQRCIGARTHTGTEYYASIVLLSLGAALPSFLEREGRSIGDICEAIAIPWMCVQLSDQKYNELMDKGITVLPGRGTRRFPCNCFDCEY